jgi:hypothetical protein
MHVYIEEMEKVKKRGPIVHCDLYSTRQTVNTPLFQECVFEILEEIKEWTQNPTAEPKLSNCDLVTMLLTPMARAHSERKNISSALSHLIPVKQAFPDWALAAENWLNQSQQRTKSREIQDYPEQ